VGVRGGSGNAIALCILYPASESFSLAGRSFRKSNRWPVGEVACRWGGRGNGNGNGWMSADVIGIGALGGRYSGWR